ncbi:hypothetical protein A3A21_02705 [Candidatus Jorgensenbacteria bacterium RIFCSPLOWO2_01_FULL_45_25b]|uniref:Uncharacterized protein n=1 Tax=Candidatus Jorgensenbacteria bacterium RIFCSPLOWO2_01_FULL_45_25b TaxID=1798471 RepID=A0A1F6C079_9BACT|nr:MAG: hypothetical protein A3A21_02705 [Candidatus Jorgensenbacteria bacterium RIFCSPLOWO2_01_FULL_45_25b]
MVATLRKFVEICPAGAGRNMLPRKTGSRNILEVKFKRSFYLPLLEEKQYFGHLTSEILNRGS